MSKEKRTIKEELFKLERAIDSSKYEDMWRGIAIEQTLSAIQEIIKECMPCEDSRKGVMPYEQGLIDGWNSARNQFHEKLKERMK